MKVWEAEKEVCVPIVIAGADGRERDGEERALWEQKTPQIELLLR